MAEKAVPQKNLVLAEKEVADVKKKTLKKEEKRPIYSFDEAFKASLEYFKGDELAARVWVNKYALKDSSGKIYERTPDDMHHRLASEIHRIEKRYENPLSYDELFGLMQGFKYIVPQGSPMTGIGNNFAIKLRPVEYALEFFPNQIVRLRFLHTSGT